MRILTFFLISFYFMIGCQKKEEIISTPKSNNIVLIFNGCPDNSRYTFWNKMWTHNEGYQIKYIDDKNIVRLINPKLKPEKDTILIKTEQEIIEVQHAYNGIDNLSYLFQNGDSVLFTYIDNKPIATIINRSVNPDEVNYELKKREKIVDGGFPGLIKMHGIFALADSTLSHLKTMEKVDIAEKTGKLAAINEYTKEIKYLDSLNRHKLISEKAYNFYKLKSAYNVAKLQLPPARIKQNTNPDKGLNILSREKINEIPKIEDLLKSSSDTLIKSFYYQELLKHVLFNVFDPKAERIITRNSHLPNYSQVYDSINDADFLKDHQKKFLLYTTMGHIIENSSIDETYIYWSKFKKDVPDSAFIENISNKYKLTDNVSDDLVLTSLDQEKTTFGDILNKYKGKVIYVDFWASWCAPCIKALPDSHTLQEELRDKDVVFVFISLDENFEKWKKGAEKHNLHANSYLVDNKFTSRMLDDLNVQSIPRYLIYDTNGKLIHKNAPGPKGPEIRKLLDKSFAVNKKFN